jgi:uncharacterized membrane protein YtjA (UPF0391 family)
MRWLVLVAGYSATAQDTNDSLRKPFQFGRGAMDANSLRNRFRFFPGDELRVIGTGSPELSDGIRVASPREFTPKEIVMLGWAVTFLIIALLAAVLGFGGIAGVAIEAAKLVFFVAVVLFLIAALVGIVRGRTPRIP